MIYILYIYVICEILLIFDIWGVGIWGIVEFWCFLGYLGDGGGFWVSGYILKPVGANKCLTSFILS